MRTTQAGSSRVDEMGSPIYLRNFTAQESNRFLYKDLKEDVGGTRGCKSETAMKSHRQIMEAKTRLRSGFLSLLWVQRDGWSGRKTKKRQLMFAVKCCMRPRQKRDRQQQDVQKGQSPVRGNWLLAGG